MFAAVDQFRKVRRPRADYIGQWLPEPLRTEESADGREERRGAALPTGQCRASVSPRGWARSSSG
ncbi:hypothetical protein ACFOY2_28185 [Nonomuraea purpurea]|uniref:Uncharacterized protein n=1 Tax=Nonomuraea purpurea TaxID=1849276 RepID=A0ABV8GAZ2_9ACTN